MRFLVDQNRSPLLADELRRAGHDVVHTRDIDLRTADDEVILQRALDEARVLISADTDFGFLLAESGAGRPSVVLLCLRSPRPAGHLAAGAIVVLEDERIRVRQLPVA